MATEAGSWMARVWPPLPKTVIWTPSPLAGYNLLTCLGFGSPKIGHSETVSFSVSREGPGGSGF